MKGKQADNAAILIVDDEPSNVYWLIDYIEAEGYAVTHVTNLNDAIREIGSKVYRAAIIDLNIPALEPLSAELRKEGGAYARFPGLYAARHARNSGYRDRQTIIYSVHQDPEVRHEANRMLCTYLIKGRPKAFKDELTAVLAFDPTKDAAVKGSRKIAKKAVRRK